MNRPLFKIYNVFLDCDLISNGVTFLTFFKLVLVKMKKAGLKLLNWHYFIHLHF